MTARTGLIALFVTILLGPLAACGGGGSPGPLPGVQEARAERDVADGAATLRSTITVRFDRDFKVDDGRVPFASRFELSIPDPLGGSKASRVLVDRADRSEQNPRLVTLRVNRLVPAGAELRIARAAFQDSAEGTITAEVVSDLTPAMMILASTALTFTSADFIASGAPTDVRPEDRDVAVQRAALSAHLDKRGADASQKRDILARFDRIPEATVPSPKARAALAALTATFAEPAIDYLLTADNCTGKPASLIAFQPPPDSPKLLARSTRARDGRRVISLNPAIEGERMELLMPLLAHEAIHCDTADGRFEEVAATALDTFFYLNLLSLQPELAKTGTLLARELNLDALALINSGRRFPESAGVLKSAGVGAALPNTNSTAPSFADFIVAAYPSIDLNESPEEPLARIYTDRLAKGVGMASGPSFNLRYLDELLGRATDPRVLAAVIAILELAPAG